MGFHFSCEVIEIVDVLLVVNDVVGVVGCDPGVVFFNEILKRDRKRGKTVPKHAQQFSPRQQHLLVNDAS